MGLLLMALLAGGPSPYTSPPGLPSNAGIGGQAPDGCAGDPCTDAEIIRLNILRPPEKLPHCNFYDDGDPVVAFLRRPSNCGI